MDVGYRGRLSPEFLFLGKQALEKYEIALEFQARAAGLGLTLDIETDEAKRIYGEAWLAFLGNCRATLGVEAGVSVFDIDDVAIPAYERLRQAEPELSPEQVYERTVKPYDGVGVYYRTVSPRVFEAAATGTCQILYEGKYSGVVEPWVHYLPLQKDFANFDEIIRLYRDEGVRRQLVQQAERDLIASGAYSYRRFIAQFDAGLVAAGLQTQIPDRTVRRVNDALWEGERSLVFKKIGTMQVEHQGVLQEYVVLQELYMKQQTDYQDTVSKYIAKIDALQEEHQGILQEYVALQELYMKQQTDYQDTVSKYIAKIDALQEEHQGILQEYVALQELYMKQQTDYQDTVSKYIALQVQHSTK